MTKKFFKVALLSTFAFTGVSKVNAAEGADGVYTLMISQARAANVTVAQGADLLNTAANAFVALKKAALASKTSITTLETSIQTIYNFMVSNGFADAASATTPAAMLAAIKEQIENPKLAQPAQTSDDDGDDDGDDDFDDGRDLGLDTSTVPSATSKLETQKAMLIQKLEFVQSEIKDINDEIAPLADKIGTTTREETEASIAALTEIIRGLATKLTAELAKPTPGKNTAPARYTEIRKDWSAHAKALSEHASTAQLLDAHNKLAALKEKHERLETAAATYAGELEAIEENITRVSAELLARD